MRWREGRSSFADEAPERPESWTRRFFDERYLVARISSTNVARDFVFDHHYSGSYPSDKFRYGMFDPHNGGRLVGVAVLSTPSNDKALTNVFPSLRPSYESLELGRFVLLDEVPSNAETWMIAKVKRLALEDGVLGIMAASDPVPRTDLANDFVFAGHHGLIYQASNALYCGRQTRSTRLLLPDGRVFDGRTQNKVRNPDSDSGIRGVGRMLAQYGIELPKAEQHYTQWINELKGAGLLRAMRHPGNHRYAMPLRRDVRIGLTVEERPRGVDPIAIPAAIALATRAQESQLDLML